MTIDSLRKIYENSDKRAIAVYVILKFLIIFCLIREIFLQNYHNALLCVVTIVLFGVPTFAREKLKVNLPNALEISILIFIFAAEILGEIENFYGNIPSWDMILHTTNGFLAASVGFSLIDLLNKEVKDINMTPLFVAIFAFCFSMTIGVLWEFFEYSADTFFQNDMQKDTLITSVSSVSFNEELKNEVVTINDIDHTVLYDAEGNEIIVIKDGYLDIGIKDTMEDLFVNFIGALTFSIFGYLYIVNGEKFKLANAFKIRKRTS